MTNDERRGTNDEGRGTRDEGRETNSSQTPEGEYMEEGGGG